MVSNISIDKGLKKVFDWCELELSKKIMRVLYLTKNLNNYKSANYQRESF